MPNQDFDFERLIQPIDIATFLENYWQQRSLVLIRKQADYYASLFSMEYVEDLIRFTDLKSQECKVFKTTEGESVKTYAAMENSYSNSYAANQLYDAYNQGNTLCIHKIHDRCKSVATFCRNLEVFLNHPVNINLYLTPKDAQGFPPHYDTHDVFVLQIAGSKNWRIYESFSDIPLVTKGYIVDQNKLDAPLHEVCLQPGDLLYIPRGHVHEAITSETSSLHLTVGVSVFEWATLINEAIASVAEQNVNFRKALPVGFLHHSEAKASIKNQLAQLLQILAESANDEDAMERLTKRFISGMSPLPDGHFISLDAVNQINPNTTIAKRQGMICQITKKVDSVMIQFPGGEVTGPPHIEPALRFIANSEEFLVKDLPGFLSNNSKLVLVQRLLKEGLLKIQQRSISTTASLKITS
ncbi:MAG: cupin domain-containing protein [Nostoc sp. DedQUE12a]|nr:cupin domain-containing protein [Nostoc sp. DedQUE12a]